MIEAVFIEARASEECGCPEEAWLVGSIDLTIHIEPEGHVHAFMDGGDWGECETMLYDARSLDEGREKALAWAREQFA